MTKSANSLLAMPFSLVRLTIEAAQALLDPLSICGVVLMVHRTQGMAEPVIPRPHDLPHGQEGRAVYIMHIEGLPRLAVVGTLRHGTAAGEATRMHQGHSLAAADG
jgi:hypothetical protein